MATNNNSVLKDSEIDRIVAEYLRKRNFNDTLKVLELEIKATGGAEGPSALGASGGVEDLLLATRADGNPAAYASEFTSFSRWVDGSLQPYRTELSSLLYPTFIHTYLNMISLRATAEAHALFGEHKQRFLGVGGLSAKHREEELHELQNITMPEQLATNRLARSMRSERFPIRLSRYAYDMMVHHLQVAQLFLLLGVINEHVAIEVTDLPQPIAADAAAMTAPDLADAAAVNQVTISLQLLKNGIEQKYVELMAQRAEEEATAKAEEAELTKKQRTALQKQATSAKTRRETVGDDRMMPQIPLPEVSEERQAALLKEMELREQAGAGTQPLSATALPSAAFFTFVNTSQSLQCVSFTSDVTRVAAGFADSSVRLYNMAPNDDEQQQQKAGEPLYFRGHSGPVYSLDFSADDSLLLSGSADGTVRLWSTQLSMALTAYRGHMLPVWDVSFAPHYGYYFATGGADRVTRVWNTERSQALRMFVGHQSDVDVVRWHPNCHYVASGSSDRTIRLWDIRTGNCVRILAGHGAGVTAMSFSPDGATLVSGDAEGGLISWDLASAKQLAAVLQHKGAVWSIAHSQGDGAIVASGGADCTVRLYSGVQNSAGADKRKGTATANMLQHLTTWKTKATPVASLAFTRRNLLLGAGGLALQLPKPTS